MKNQLTLFCGITYRVFNMITLHATFHEEHMLQAKPGCGGVRTLSLPLKRLSNHGASNLQTVGRAQYIGSARV